MSGPRLDRGFAPGHSMLTGPANLSDAPLTVEDWRIIYHAYYGFITIVRKVAADAWKRHDEERRATSDDAGQEGACASDTPS